MIVVHADMDAIVRKGELAGEPVTVESDKDSFGYMADAVLAATYIVAYAEETYGPIVADLIIEALKGDVIKKSIDVMRKEKQECESGE